MHTANSFSTSYIITFPLHITGLAGQRAWNHREETMLGDPPLRPWCQAVADGKSCWRSSINPSTCFLGMDLQCCLSQWLGGLGCTHRGQGQACYLLVLQRCPGKARAIGLPALTQVPLSLRSFMLPWAHCLALLTYGRWLTEELPACWCWLSKTYGWTSTASKADAQCVQHVRQWGWETCTPGPLCSKLIISISCRGSLTLVQKYLPLLANHEKFSVSQQGSVEPILRLYICTHHLQYCFRALCSNLDFFEFLSRPRGDERWKGQRAGMCYTEEMGGERGDCLMPSEI